MCFQPEFLNSDVALALRESSAPGGRPICPPLEHPIKKKAPVTSTSSCRSGSGSRPTALHPKSHRPRQWRRSSSGWSRDARDSQDARRNQQHERRDPAARRVSRWTPTTLG
ncbi:unnamed protein product [Vitrella brassicaformis CCMP3155]|uniref:Uncharacterized protein n=1 Tax=Vitrella brassicaformis (strain CCMP3155) TaxID=1169540 RepID=A0A0G4F0D3_VITBC|nr:unnamed protein product [Vitrella brassicaformis CCMP3155]|eukprot:CEM05178.1 unnamed protein product [Vitrella brassicaformis CCMP3155]